MATNIKLILLFILRFIKKTWIFTSIIIGSTFLILIILILTSLFILGPPTLDGIETNSVSEEVLEGEVSEKIVLIKLNGLITDGTPLDLFSSLDSFIEPEQIRKFLLQAEKDPLVKAVVFRVNSPGGSVVASDEIFNRIKEFNQKTNIPTVAYLGDTAASGGYYISLASNKIVANPSSITGSIGAIAHFPSLEGLYEKIGVESRIIKSGPLKDIGSEAREITEQEREILQDIVNQSYEQFLNVVSESRKIDKEELRLIADGRIYSGKQALELNLVDQIGTFSKAIEEAKNLSSLEEFTLVEYKSGGLFESLIGFTNQRFNLVNPLNILINSGSASVLYLWLPQ